MRASEQLGALDAGIRSMRISESDSLWLDLQPEIVSLRNALPLIADVIEAAEAVVHDDCWDSGVPDDPPDRLIRSLAALTDKLNTP